MEEKLIQKSCQDFAAALAAKTPVPGGGGASALVGALGAALGSMTANFTVGKKKYAAVEADVQRLLDEADALRARFLELVDADAEAFQPLSKAYAIPKDDPGKEAVMEECLRRAATVPMEILRLSCKAIDLHRELEQKGSALMQADVGTGVVFCRSALYGAWLNVKVNTKSMGDRAYAEALNAEADGLVEQYGKIADQVYEAVMGRYS